MADYGDHFEIFGFSLIKYNAYREKLEKLREEGNFLGFAPRWQLPIKIRNISNIATNTSNILVIHDSRSEIAQGLAPYFSNEVLGDSEVVISSYALS